MAGRRGSWLWVCGRWTDRRRAGGDGRSAGVPGRPGARGERTIAHSDAAIPPSGELVYAGAWFSIRGDRLARVGAGATTGRADGCQTVAHASRRRAGTGRRRWFRGCSDEWFGRAVMGGSGRT
ncbi:hypothetical protein YW7DRAFT_00865 [Streptomyces sp. AmelKG-E11A]|nr:hypothetical protein YW7DRAFT_00865 [Streptomyces sp. AmelKG-E11A]